MTPNERQAMEAHLDDRRALSDSRHLSFDSVRHLYGSALTDRDVPHLISPELHQKKLQVWAASKLPEPRHAWRLKLDLPSRFSKWIVGGTRTTGLGTDVDLRPLQPRPDKGPKARRKSK